MKIFHYDASSSLQYYFPIPIEIESARLGAIKEKMYEFEFPGTLLEHYECYQPRDSINIGHIGEQIVSLVVFNPIQLICLVIFN